VRSSTTSPARRPHDFLLGDDEWEEALDLGPEERPLHESDGADAVSADEVELAETREQQEEPLPGLPARATGNA
jgi:hypothetical protein